MAGHRIKTLTAAVANAAEKRAAGHRDAVTEASCAWLATTLNQEVRIQ